MLFQADNHFPDKCSFGTVEQHSENLVLFNELYHLTPDEESFQLISGANVNSKNYCDSRYYYKHLCNADSKPYVLNFPEITELLISAGIPCARFIENKDSKLISSDSALNSFFYVQDYIKGDFYSGLSTQFEEALDLLVRFRNLDNTTLKIGRESPFIEFSPEYLLPKIIKELQASCESDFNQIVKRGLDEIVDLLQVLQPTIQKLKSKPESLHHYDIHPHNLIFKDDKLVALVDLESIYEIHREVCEAFALYKLGRKSIAKNYLTLSEFKDYTIQKGFNLQELKPYVQAELLRRLFLILELHYLKNNTEWDVDFSKHLNSLKEIDLMFN